MALSAVADYSLQIAFNENVAGIFYIETSAIDGTDGLTDSSVISGTFTDVTDNVVDGVTVAAGTDQLAASVQAGSLTAELLNPANLSYWNPNNPSSPLNSAAPGFVPMRPVTLTATFNSVTYGIFSGFIRRADWNSDTCSVTLYCEDLLLWASRAYPVIGSTGPTTTGAAIALVLDAMGWSAGSRHLDIGDTIPDFSADGSISALQIIQNLLDTERGTVYHRGDGVLVYEARGTTQARASSWTLDDELTLQQSGIDLDSIFTRASVTGTSGIAQTAVGAAAESTYGRADFSAITSDYIDNDSQALALAQDIVYGGGLGLPPITVTVDNDSSTTLTSILTSPLLSVFTVSETLGNTAGNYVVQRIAHTIRTQAHKTEYLLTKRTSAVFTVDTAAIDGSDGTVLRY